MKKKWFIAMAGNIGSGKTTAAKLLSTHLGLELFDEPVIDNRFLKNYYQDMERWSFTLQLEFLIKRTKHHELIRNVPKSCIQDRTLYEDPEIFAKYLHGLGYMTDAELELYYDYFDRLSHDLLRPDLVVVLEVQSVNTLLTRIRTRGRQEERSIDSRFLNGLNAYYSTFAQVASRKYDIPVLCINTEEIDIRSTEGCETLITEVKRKLKEVRS